MDSLSGKRPDFVVASDEFQRVCEYQLRLMSEVFASKGELVGSIYMRLPGTSRATPQASRSLVRIAPNRIHPHPAPFHKSRYSSAASSDFRRSGLRVRSNGMPGHVARLSMGSVLSAASGGCRSGSDLPTHLPRLLGSRHGVPAGWRPPVIAPPPHPSRVLHVPALPSIFRARAGSLRDGSLELQRICWTPRGAHAETTSQEAILIGGPGSNLTEGRVTAQTSFSLPGRGHVVLPLVSSAFLVGLIVLEGFNVGKAPADDFGAPATPTPGRTPPTSIAADSAAAPPPPPVLPSPVRSQARSGPADALPSTPADHFVRLASHTARTAAARPRLTLPSAILHYSDTESSNRAGVR